jgi:hypothetical protein
MVRGRLLLLIGASCALAAAARADDKARDKDSDKEPLAVVELGGATESGLPGVSSFGPSAAVEFTVVKEWLEVEAGVAPMFSHGSTDWETGLVFKKPFKLSDKVEFMIGAGPQWTFTREGTRVGGTLAADFMIWPTADRRFGWFVQPAYTYSFSSGHEQTLGVTAGLLIAIQ